ncbi:hypothetical protein DVA43_02440 [Leclercia sp. W6]|uniref:hypothetical protein n=1 Tax=Leclercia sp. W6 TaxID=2282310 RepID=UPI000DF44CC7|nr:hypothetical protein [Leclercia sp. W6]AXF58493.1 hypothetical protein DVA43_02440 [Leclercia sp. W6]
MKAPAARLNAGQEIRHRKRWTAIRSVTWQTSTTRITLEGGEVVTYWHDQIINYRTPAVDRHSGPVYASRIDADTKADTAKGIESIRAK